MARIAAREHVDLLVLCALRRGPADGPGVMERVRTDSHGAFTAPERTIYRTLHRLARNRLLERRPDPRSGRPGWALSDVGARVTTARVREWRAFVRGMDAVVRASEPS